MTAPKRVDGIALHRFNRKEFRTKLNSTISYNIRIYAEGEGGITSRSLENGIGKGNGNENKPL